MKKPVIKKYLLILGFFLVFSFKTAVAAGEDPGSENAGNIKNQTAEELLEEIDFTKIQNMMDDMLGQNSFSLTDAIKRLMSGEEILSGETVREYLRGLFFNRLEQEKSFFLKILLCVFMAAVFSNFAGLFENGQIGDMSFYMVYLLLFMLLMNAFSALTASLTRLILWLASFMKLLSPAFFLALAASVGITTASVFQEGLLLLVWLLQWILGSVLVPAASLYVLFRMVNHLSKEEMLGKMADLMENLICWGTRTIMGTVLGLQVVRSLVAPVMDSLKRGVLGKTAGSIPGIGNAVNAVTELVITSAVLVRNSLGVAFVVVFVLVGLEPVIRYGIFCLGMRLLAAMAEPVSDKRIVGCLSAMGEGCAVLLRIFLTAEVLCILVFLIIMVNFGGSR
ncbi:MAG: stage III sporulation protein AE [Blautia sp.]|nr:stage III sporulation protein AE [Blautia sp.]